jgi:hypothetical protein
MQSSFFASFMCFEVLPLNPHGAEEDKDDDEDGISATEMDGSDKPGKQIWLFAIITSNYALAVRLSV